MDATDFLTFKQVMIIVQERIRLLNRGSTSTGGSTIPAPRNGLGAAAGPSPMAAAAHHSVSAGGTQHPATRRRITMCYRCYRTGHIASECLGERVEGCRTCKTADHTAATCPVDGAPASSFQSASSLRPPSSPVGPAPVGDARADGRAYGHSRACQRRCGC